MMRFVPLTEELLAGALLEEPDGLAQEMAREAAWHTRLLPPNGIGYAMIGGGRVLAAGGVTRLWDDRWEAWLILSPHATRRERVVALRRVQLSLDTLQALPGFRRIEMYVRADRPWAERFGDLLRFRPEGLMRGFDPWGRDYRLYARVAEGG